MGQKNHLRVAVVGCGEIAQLKHIPSLLKIEGVEVVAVCDKNADLAKRVSQRFRIGRYYTDFSEMLDRERTDVVDICTPPQTHLALSTQAMASGCHVLMEKPMALSLKEADKIADTAKASHVELCVVHNMLFLPVVMKAMSIVNRGIIGDIVQVSIKDTLPSESSLILDKGHWCHKLPGGVFGEMLAHPIYLATALVGSLEPVVVHSRRMSGRDWLVADEVRIILESKNSLVTINSSLNVPEDTKELDILGTRMSLHVDLWGAVMVRYGVGREGRLSRGWGNISWSLQKFLGTASTGLNIISGRHHSDHYTLIKRFVSSLRNGTGPPVTVADAREVVRLYEAITSQIQPKAGL